MKHFFSNVMLTFRGALIGQIIPVLAMPIISRLYDADVYGVFASLLSLSAVFSTLIMLQFEVSVVMPEDDAEAGGIARTALQIGMFMCAALTILMIVLQPWLREWEGLANLSGWSVMTPLLAFLMGMAMLGNYVASRLQIYKEIGASAAALQIVNCTAIVLFGVFKPAVSSLISGRIFGQIGAVGGYIGAMRWLKKHFRDNGLMRWAQMREVISKYRKFPLFSLPHTLLSQLSRECVPPILIYFHQPHAAGYYALVRSVLMMPVSLISTSIGQIFYREASRGVDDPAFKSFTYSLMLAIAAIVTPGCVFLAVWAPQVFAFAFGDDWMGVGKYAIVFMPVAMLFILSIWVARIFEVRMRQDLLFRIQLVFDTLSLGTLIYMLAHNPSPLRAIAAYAACQVLYLLTYIGFVFRLMHLPMVKYMMLMALTGFAGALQFALHEIIVRFVSGIWAPFGVEMAITGPAILGGMFLFWRHFRHHPALHPAEPVEAEEPLAPIINTN